ncbi:class I SAM-dependent methyltransferase [Roseibium sp. RKSG952]|nr:class I SAM-dependent methyltransferase [Roseibium sp. RKSG952]
MDGRGKSVHYDPDFMARRNSARARLDRLKGADTPNPEDRFDWFRSVYKSAQRDPAVVPWADLAPKDALVQWLSAHPGRGKSAIDIGCGLGDNAEALSEAGYRTTAFDLSEEAILWTRERFPESAVSYRVEDLTQLPVEWAQSFDLVHECYTVQALMEPIRTLAIEVTAGLVAPGGILLFLNRCRPEGSKAEGRPIPALPSEWRRYQDFGLELVEETFFDVERPGRSIPHVLAEFKRPDVR